MPLFKADFKQSASTSPLWTFTVCLAFVVWTPAQGETRVICSPEPIIAAPGDDVILPCHLEPEMDVQDWTVEWSKPDPPGRPKYVHIYRGREEVLDMKFPSYAGRTALFVDDLRHGNISLKITNVTVADDGTYRCYMPKLPITVRDAVVRLVVDPNFVQTWTTETSPLPTNRSTPDPQDRTSGIAGGRSRLVFWVLSGCALTSVFLILFMFCRDQFREQDVSQSYFDKGELLLV